MSENSAFYQYMACIEEALPHPNGAYCGGTGYIFTEFLQDFRLPETKRQGQLFLT